MSDYANKTSILQETQVPLIAAPPPEQPVNIACVCSEKAKSGNVS